MRDDEFERFWKEVVVALLRYYPKSPEENHEKCCAGYPVPWSGLKTKYFNPENIKRMF